MLKPAIINQEEETQYNWSELQRDLDRAKSALFMASDAAFFGPLMCSLDFEWAKGLDTAGTDGTKFYWDPEDFLRMDLEGRKATIMHELWHVARLHPLRRGNRCPDVWNKAADIVINRELYKQGYTFIKDSPYWLYRPEFDHLQLEEEIYDELNKPGQSPPPNQPGGTSGNQQDLKGHKCVHGTMEVSAADKQRMINATVKAVQSAKISQQAGAIPGGIETTLDKFLKPKIPWEAVLYNFFNDLGDEDYSWARPNRRSQEVYLPSRVSNDRLEHLCYYLDVSGSVSDQDVLRFNSEVKFIKDVFNPVKLTLVQFDTKIQKIDEFDEDTRFEKIVVVGRGGTCLKPVREHILEHRPTAAIIFSDLYCDPMEPGVASPVIWVAVGNESAQVKFGKIIHIKGE